MLKSGCVKDEIFSTPAFLRSRAMEVGASSGVAIAHRRTASVISASSYEAAPTGADAPANCPNSGEAVVHRRKSPEDSSNNKNLRQALCRSSEVSNIFSFAIYLIRLWQQPQPSQRPDADRRSGHPHPRFLSRCAADRPSSHRIRGLQPEYRHGSG